MELEYQRRHPRDKVIEYGNIDFSFEDDGECIVRHNDGRLGEINIDPDEITVNVSYRNKKVTIMVESDKRLAPRDIMDIIGDFLDYDHNEDALTPVPVKRVVQPTTAQYPILKWLIEAFVTHMYRIRSESEAGLTYEAWLDSLELNRNTVGPFAVTDTSELTEMEFCNVIGKLGYLPQEVFDNNVKLVVNTLLVNDGLPENLKPLCKQWIEVE